MADLISTAVMAPVAVWMWLAAMQVMDLCLGPASDEVLDA